MSGVNRLINNSNTVSGNSLSALKAKLTGDANQTAASVGCIPCKTTYKTSNKSILRNSSTKKK